MSLRPSRRTVLSLPIRKPAGWWWSTPQEVYAAETCWTAMRLNGQLVGLKLQSKGTVQQPKIHCVVYCRGSIDAVGRQGIERILRRALKIDEDLCDFYRLAQKDPILRDAVKDLYGMHSVSWPELFPALILAVTLQMAPMKRSNEMMDALLNQFGDTVSFDGKTMGYWPSTETIAKCTVEELMAKAKVGYRAKNLIAIAEEMNRGFPTLEELSEMPPEDAKQKLLSLRGIGDYSAELVMPRMGFPLDVWSAKIFSVLFNGAKPKNPREAIPELKEAAEKRWNGWMGHAFVYILNDLPELSKRIGVDLSVF